MNIKKVLSEVQGSVWTVDVVAGQRVSKGDVLLVVESMKMEIALEAEADGTVVEVLVAKGDAVAEDQPVVLLSV